MHIAISNKMIDDQIRYYVHRDCDMIDNLFQYVIYDPRIL